jgi:hypothetical protein
MRTGLTLFLLALSAAFAQQPVAPTPDTVGSPRGTNAGDYNITQSFELGYRWSVVDGNGDMYRAVDNYGNGIRLLGSSLTVNSKDGHGRYFDEILLNTLGLGNDPYESVVLRVAKNGLYQYDLHWRLNDYFNPGLTTSAGLHRFDTSYHVQDHDLTLLPKSKIRFRLGFSRTKQDGPALSTVQQFDSTGAALPVFTDLRQQWTEYRLGTDIDWKGFRFVVTHRWDYFKDDSPFDSVGTVTAPATNGNVVLNQFQRSSPIHGSSPGWLGNVFTRRRKFGMDARMTYTSGTRDFANDEFATGLNQFGGVASRQIAVGGSAQRPMLAGDFNLNLFPIEKLSVTNTTAVTDNRIDGSAIYSEINTGTDLGATVYFRYLAIRLVTNSTLANYRVNRWLGFYGGYAYSNRLVTTIEAADQPAIPGSSQRDVYEVSNSLSTGRVGVRMNPWKPLTFNLDGEIGRANNPLTPVSEKNYHTINGRVQYRARNVQLSGSYAQLYNLNPDAAPISTLTSFSSHSRNYTANASWSPHDWFSLDASYMKLHLDSLSGLAFFASTTNRAQLQTSYSSLYISNIHAANLAVHFTIRRRIDLFAGYSLTKDTGDGRATAVPPGTTDPIQSLLSSVQTYPLTYQSPMARLSIRITPKIRWNAGWQFYNYAEQFQLFGFYQNFHANTGYTSVLWSF